MTNECTVVAQPNVMNGEERVFAQFQAGQSLTEMLGEFASHACEVQIGGYPVPRTMWPKVKPRAGQYVHVVVFPQGGNGGKILRIAAIVALTVFAGPLGAVVGQALGVGTAIGTGIVMAVGTLAINALIPPPTPKSLGGGGGDAFNQLATITGTSNQAAPYNVIPCVVGSYRMFPPHAALPYTEISGNDQYLRMLLDLGYGDLDISDIQIGSTPIESYDDVEWQISTTPTLFSQDIFEAAVGTALNNSGDNDTRTTQTGTTEISLDMVFSGGFYGVDNKGRTVSGSTSFTVQYRPVGSGTWSYANGATGLSLTGGLTNGGSTFNISSSAKQTLRTGIRWTVPIGQYDVKVTRGTTAFGSIQFAQSAAAWSVIRSINPQLPSTTGTLKLAVRIKATDQLQGVVQNLSVLASQKIPRWDKGAQAWLPDVATNNPAWIYAWLMTRCPAVMRRLPDSRLDLDGIADWASECDTKGLQIGFVMDSSRAFGDVVRDVLAAGRASFGLRNGRYSGVRDLPQTVPVQMFTPVNSYGFSYARVFSNPPHALRVKFTNPEASWQQDVRVVYWDGYNATNATRFEELDLRMVTDPDAAWRLGRYHLAVIWKRPTTYTFSADIEHMVCERGDLVHVAHDIIAWGLAWGRVKALGGSTITLDGPVTLESGKSYQVRIRGANGTESTANVTNGAGTWISLNLGSTPACAPGDLFVLGEVNRTVAELIVKSVLPSNDLSAQLVCVDAAPDVLTADAGTPPPFVSDITGVSWCAPPDPPVVTIRAGDSAADDAGVVQASPGVSGAPAPGIYRVPISAGGCVVTDSLLPDMRRAGEVAVGDYLQMADQVTLADRTDRVTYSEPKLQPCVEIVTVSGAVLRCSTSAPIPTPSGVVLAPHLAGRRVAVKDGDGVRWEAVARLRGIGMQVVQHITVNDGCFWAGAEPGRYILHHNKRSAEVD